MLKILSVVGARPQIIKASAISRAVQDHFKSSIAEVILHTGQHYDDGMSDVFFRELGLPKPAYNLNAGSSSHAQQTGRMMEGAEEVMLQVKPDCVIVYGDTNSTLAAAVAAAKLGLKIAHVEAGLRSFNRSMPEEINRILTDHVSTFLFSPTKTGVDNLVREGFKKGARPPYSPDNPAVYHCGDVMYDNSLFFAAAAKKKPDVLSDCGVEEGAYVLVTIHRDSNTDDPERINAILTSLNDITEQHGVPVVFPVHPRTRKALETHLSAALYSRTKSNRGIRIIPPASFLDMIVLESRAKLVITDSGGVQKEACFFKKPCIVLRPETEWVELVENGSCLLADANHDRILAAFRYFASAANLSYPKIFGDGRAARFILNELANNLA